MQFTPGACGTAGTAGKTKPTAATREAIAQGESFLAGLFDPELSLLPEFRGSRTYWLFHDNHLAARVLDTTHPDLARKKNPVSSFALFLLSRDRRVARLRGSG